MVTRPASVPCIADPVRMRTVGSRVTVFIHARGISGQDSERNAFWGAGRSDRRGGARKEGHTGSVVGAAASGAIQSRFTTLAS
eukprot:2852317-Rhodomonas_salina.2